MNRSQSTSILKIDNKLISDYKRSGASNSCKKLLSHEYLENNCSHEAGSIQQMALSILKKKKANEAPDSQTCTESVEDISLEKKM
jgi:hypothetical protein